MLNLVTFSFKNSLSPGKKSSKSRNRDASRRLRNSELEDRFQKKAIFKSHIPEIADKKTAYNEGRLYYFFTHNIAINRSFWATGFDANQCKLLEKRNVSCIAFPFELTLIGQ